MARVLIIDDDAEIRLLATRVLEKAGHEVATANDGNVGIELFQERTFDLVITDMEMPHLGGREVIRILRRIRPGVRIVAISGKAFVGPEGHLTEADVGADRLLDKPYRNAQLQSVIHEVIATPEHG